MTRISVLILLFLSSFALSFSSISLDSESYVEALRLIEDYSPYASNLTYIKELLEESAKLGNSDAMGKLGEFWLLGYPVSPESPSYNADFVENGKFVRNIDLAMHYFKKSLHKSKDSSYFASLILQQSLIIDTFDKYLPLSDHPISTFQSLEEKTLTQMSGFGILSSIFHHERCKHIAYVPEFLRKQYASFANYPFYSPPKCGHTCEELAHLAVIPATEALKYIFRTQRSSNDPRAIDDTVEIHGESYKNLLKLYGKQLQDHPPSMSALASYYIKGDPWLGVAPEISTGLNLLEKAAISGDVLAHEKLGIMYSRGIGVEKNATKGIEHLKIARDKGSITSEGVLGELYLKGEGVEKDIILGLKVLKNSADKGSLESISILGRYYFFEKDWDEANIYLQQASLFGVPEAMYYMGIMYLKGLGVEKNCYQALGLLKKVVLKGEIGTYAEKAYLMFLYQDYEGAFWYSVVGASLGVETSILSLAYMYENDLIPEKYLCSQGKEYCSGAYYSIAYKSLQAKHNLGKILLKGSKNIQKSTEEAKKLFLQSISLPESYFELARMYEYGLGVEKNLTAAITIYEDIIKKAEKGIYQAEAKYPALIALYWAKAKTYPLIGELIEDFYGKETESDYIIRDNHQNIKIFDDEDIDEQLYEYDFDALLTL